MTLSHPSKVEPGVGRVLPGLGIGVVENLAFLFYSFGEGFDRRYFESGWRMAETSVVLNPVGQLEKNLKHSKSVEVLEATLC